MSTVMAGEMMRSYRPDGVGLVVVGGAQRVGTVLDLHGARVRLLHGHLELVVLTLQLLRFRQRARDGE